MVVVVPGAQGNAGQLESYTQSTPGLQVEIIRAFEIGRDWHGCAPLAACQAGAQSVSQPSVPDCWLLLANDGNSIPHGQVQKTSWAGPERKRNSPRWATV